MFLKCAACDNCAELVVDSDPLWRSVAIRAVSIPSRCSVGWMWCPRTNDAAVVEVYCPDCCEKGRISVSIA